MAKLRENRHFSVVINKSFVPDNEEDLIARLKVTLTAIGYNFPFEEPISGRAEIEIKEFVIRWGDREKLAEDLAEVIMKYQYKENE